MNDKRVKIFELIKNEYVDLLIQHCEVRKFGPDEVIVSEGMPGDHLYIILKGELGVVKKNEKDEYIITRLVEGDIFGEISFMMHTPMTATVSSITDTSILAISHETLTDEIAKNKDLGISIYEAISFVLSDKLKKMNHTMSTGLAKSQGTSSEALPDNSKALISELKKLIYKTVEKGEVKGDENYIAETQKEFDRIIAEIFSISEIQLSEYRKMSIKKAEEFINNIKQELLPCLLDSNFFEHFVSVSKKDSEDSYILDTIYHAEEKFTHHIPDYITHAIVNLSYCKPIKKRCEMISDFLREFLKTSDKHIVSVFNSPCYELANLNPDDIDLTANKFTFLEHMPVALDKIREEFEKFHLPINADYISIYEKYSDSVRSSAKFIDKADLIYSITHFNHLDDGEFLQQLNTFYDLLTENGILILGLINPKIEQNLHVVKEIFMKSVYSRSEEEIMKLVNTSKFKGKLVDFNYDGVSGAMLCACVKQQQ